jgi:hypothetical protein
MEVRPRAHYRTLVSDINCTSNIAYQKFLKDTKRSDITFEMFSKITPLVHEAMIEKIKSGPYAINIPNLGVLKLLKLVPILKGHALIDWGRYNKTKVWAPHRNNHSDGYIYKTHLYTYAKKYPKLSFFDFQVARKHQRELARLIKNNELNR